MNRPLADKLRPDDLEKVVGQEHILGNGKILSNIIKSKSIPNMIFYGPPGVGKTTVANIIAKNSNKRFYKLNATNASVSDIKSIVDNTNTLLTTNGILLYLDEIQNFNKKQQQALLEYTENGSITLIASTTENPYFYVYNALLSRSIIFEFKEISYKDILKKLKYILDKVRQDIKCQIEIEDCNLEYISKNCGGDLRKAVNTLETLVYTTPKNKNGIIHITGEISKQCLGSNIKYDKNGDNHYDILSAFQKSIRGSDVHAALHYLARLIKASDLQSICRRLLVISSEDIGLAYPNAIVIVKSCVDSAMQLGFPEARIPLAQATILLCNSPKSNSAYKAIDFALADLENKPIGEIPMHLRDGHYSGAKQLGKSLGYKYPHDYQNNYVNQVYISDSLKDSIYYKPGNNKMEKAMHKYITSIRGE